MKKIIVLVCLTLVFAFVKCSKQTTTPAGTATYTVTFNTGDVTIVVAPQTINSGAKPTKPTDPTRKGYTFAGWYKESTFANVFDFTAPITANTTVYANWAFIPVVTTLAGKLKVEGYDVGKGTNASFKKPSGVAVDKDGNVYVADSGNNSIRMINTAGDVSTAVQPNLGLKNPNAVAVDASGNLYIADSDNNAIRKYAVVNNISSFTTLVGSLEGLNDPSSVAVDKDGNVYVSDYGNHLIRKITSAGAVTTFAGKTQISGSDNATGTAATFNNPNGVAVDGNGNVYVADYRNHLIRKITSTGVVSTLAGKANTPGSANGTGADARFNFPQAVAVDGNGNVYVADTSNQLIRMITPGGVVSTVAGTLGVADFADGSGTDAKFNNMRGIAVDASGSNVYVADSYNDLIRKIQIKP